MKCFCISKKKVIDYKEYVTCGNCGLGEKCLTLEIVGGTDGIRFNNNMNILLNRNREKKLNRILK